MPSEAFNLVRRQILNNVIRRSQRSFDISHKGLEELPSEIGNASTLSRLDIQGNEITKIPVEIGMLSRLRELFANNNKIDNIPDTIGDLQGLQVLHLYSNDIQFMPNSISKLKSLRSLDLSFNPLRELPASIGGAHKLRSLDLSNTLIVALPESIADLKELEILNISETPIHTIPQGIRDLPKLKILMMGSTNVESLPEGLGNLKSLFYLDLSNTPLKNLPSSLSELDNLTDLDLRSTNIANAEAILASMHSLRQLSLSGMTATRIEFLKELKSLRTLTITQGDLRKLPYGFRNLSSLISLNISRNAFATIPEEILFLPRLQYLDISENLLQELPHTIGTMNQMSHLDLSKNQIRSLPPEIGLLKNLTRFDVRSNALTELPREIGFVSSLANAAAKDKRPYTDGIFCTENRLKWPLEQISAFDQPRATFTLQGFLRGEIDPSSLDIEPIGNVEGEGSDLNVPDLPLQGPGPHFEIGSDGIVTFAPPEALDRAGNNVRRMESLHPSLKKLATEIVTELNKGNIPHFYLLERTQSYLNLISQDLSNININILYVEGVRLATAEEAIRPSIASHELPPLDLPVRSALDSLLRIHGTFMMSTIEGIEAISEEERYQRTPADEQKYRKNAGDFVKSLQSNPGIFDSRATVFLRNTIDDIGNGPNYERTGVVATGSLRNAAIVLTTAGTVAAASAAAIATGTVIAPIVSTAAGFLALKSLEKTKAFQITQAKITNSIDNISTLDPKIILRMLSPHLDFVIKNEHSLRQIANSSPKFDWVNASLDWIKNNRVKLK